MTTVLVTGGAGYIGSVTTDLLVARGDRVVVVDDLSRGHRQSVNADAIFLQADIGDEVAIGAAFDAHRPDAVIHFAGFIAVGESVRDPGPYLDRNVGRSGRLLDSAVRRGQIPIVFSSSAAVYGVPDSVPINEDQTKRPTSPYGWTKWAFEEILGFYDTAHGVKSASLRYFNAAGATDLRAERHDPETHLIPNILTAAATGSVMSVFGDDYPTPDGTAVRDYIHIIDLARAHLLAVDYLLDGGPTMAVNVGSGIGQSVLEVIEAVRHCTGRNVEVTMSGRRAGDPPELVADPALASEILDWRVEQSGLDEIVSSAWRAR